MSAPVTFEVAGVPAPKGSFRISRKRGGRGFVVRKDSDATEVWHALVGYAARVAMRGRGAFAAEALAVGITFLLPRPKRSRPGALPSVRPDVDKLARASIDPMQGVVFDEDSRIVDLYVCKRYAQRRPGAIVQVMPWVSGLAWYGEAVGAEVG